MEFSRQEYRRGLPSSSPGYLPNLGIELESPALQADSLLSEWQRKPKSEGCVGWESNPGQLLGRQLCSPLYHQSLNLICSVQSLSRVWLFVTPWTAAHQASLSITKPRVYSNSCPLSWWCHPTISFSVVSFSSYLQPFPASGSFQMSQFFARGGQSIGVSASSSVLPMNIQDWFPLGWAGWISLQSKGLSRVFFDYISRPHI